MNFLKGLIFTSLILLVGEGLKAQDIPGGSARWKEGSVITYKNDWVKVIVGNIPLVISVPHGGYMYPESIPDRNCKGIGNGRFVTVTDRNTIQTALAIRETFIKKFNKTPYIIISNIARKKVDQNRELTLATCENDFAKLAWLNFHNGIDTALSLAVKKFGYALYIDLHGQSHKKIRVEVGYSLNKQELKNLFLKPEDEVGDKKGFSLDNYMRIKEGSDFKQMLWGKKAFGTLLSKYGFPAVPGKQDPYPLEQDSYFSGGYNTRRYTSSKYPNVFGWQMECNYNGLRDELQNRKKFANAFLKAYRKFIAAHDLKF